MLQGSAKAQNSSQINALQYSQETEAASQGSGADAVNTALSVAAELFPDVVTREPAAQKTERRGRSPIRELAKRTEELDLSGITPEDLPLFNAAKDSYDNLKALMGGASNGKSALYLQGGGANSMKGAVGMFIGAEGTGKETAAKVLAKELGRKLYRFDQSAILGMKEPNVLKYIRTTLQNASEVKGQNRGIVYIDNFDDLLNGRSEIFKNELSRTLQKQQGLVLLASNDSRTKAPFAKATVAQIDFGANLNANARRHLWNKNLADALTDSEITKLVIDFPWMKDFQIRSAAQNAFTIAGGEGRDVTFDDVKDQVRVEAREVGEIVR